MTTRCALVCIAKGEKLYIEDFCNYYLKLGFTTIFIYDNSDNRELFYLTQKIPNLVLIHLAGIGKQIMAYNHFLKTYKHQYDYVAFFDVDEYLVLKKHKTIGEFCLEHIPSGALGINWYIFGNSGKTKYEPEPVIKRFTMRSSKMDPHVKTIAKCSDIRSMMIHHPTDLSGKPFYNIKKEPISGPFNYSVDDSIVQLNHYWTKSDEELLAKIRRGRATTFIKRKLEELTPYLYMNEVEDTFALTFLENSF